MDEVGLGKQLQAARKSAGYTQQELCHKAGLSYSTLAKIERGAIKSPSIFTIRSIAAALQTSLDSLLGLSVVFASQKQVSKSGVKFIYFDINGCLVRFYHRAFTLIALESGQPADQIETTFWHYNDAVCRGEMSMEAFNDIFAEQFGLGKEFDWRTYYLRAVEAIPEMQELMEWTGSRYYIGLLSNIMPGQVDQLKAEGFIPNVPYDAVIDSSVVKAIKPEDKIYELAEKHANVSPHEILLVDDARTNLMAAEKRGWHVLWFDDYRPDESIARIKSALE